MLGEALLGIIFLVAAILSPIAWILDWIFEKMGEKFALLFPILLLAGIPTLLTAVGVVLRRESFKEDWRILIAALLLLAIGIPITLFLDDVSECCGLPMALFVAIVGLLVFTSSESGPNR